MNTHSKYCHFDLFSNRCTWWFEKV